MKRYLQCAKQHWFPSNVTKYCTCHDKSFAWLILVTYQMSFTTRRARGLTLQPHQIVRLPRKMTRIIDARKTSFTMRGATGITLQPHQILRLPRKIALQNLRARTVEAPFTMADDSRMIRPWSEHDPSMKLQNWTRPFAELILPPSATKITKYCACHEKWHSKITKYCACHVKWLSWLMPVTYETSLFTMCGAIGITLQRHQILRLPRKIAFQNRREIVYEVSFTMRDRSENDPTMIREWSDHELVISHPPVRRGYFSRFGDAFCIDNYNISRSGYLPKFHRILRPPRKVTLQDHQILPLPRKVTLQDHQMLRLPQKVTLKCYLTELLTSTGTLLNYYFTKLLNYWLSCDFTELWLYWAVTLLSC